MKDGDILKLDMGVFHKGFHTDSALTLLVGEVIHPVRSRARAFGAGTEDRGAATSNGVHIPTSQVVYPQVRKLINVTKEALNIGISKARIGNTLGDIGSAIQNHVENNGFNVVRDLVGHGIGRELHESPQVPNYGKAGEGEELKAGMVIAIEPMVVTGGWKIKNSKDGFGFITKDGSPAAHFEHTVAITEKGPVILTE